MSVPALRENLILLTCHLVDSMRTITVGSVMPLRANTRLALARFSIHAKAVQIVMGQIGRGETVRNF